MLAPHVCLALILLQTTAALLSHKAGAGGLGAWGKAGEELDVPEVDAGDPMYDEDAALQAVVDKAKATTKKILHANGQGEEASEDEIVSLLTPAILEYFENADNADVLQLAESINFGHRRHLIIKLSEKTRRTRSACVPPRDAVYR